MIALDLFAGTGWAVACRALGIDEYGVELMPEAVATRDANGFRTLYNDVWEGLKVDGPRLDEYDLLIASPPCQTFSMAGGGAGRAALDEVLQAIDRQLYTDPELLRAFGDRHDPRTALVLAPLAHVYRDAPRFVVLEQVPPVLPVWERYAEEMRGWGYSVWTGNVQAEQYGVPQTRKRAILIARADGVKAAPPAPTHSRYYSRDPRRLDAGVLPWVSMAEALGWGMTERPMVTAGNAIGRAEGIGGSGGKAAVNREKDRGAWVMRSNYSAGGVKGSTAEERGRTLRPDVEPSLAVTGKPGHWIRPSYTVTGGGGATGGAEPFGLRARGSMLEGASRISVGEAAVLQSYPPEFVFCGTKTKQFLQIGNAVPPLLAQAILATFLPR